MRDFISRLFFLVFGLLEASKRKFNLVFFKTSFLALFLNSAFAIPVQAQSDPLDRKISAIKTAELSPALEAAELFHALESAQSTFDQSQYCGKHLDRADETAAELDRLNKIRNKTTSNYAQRANDAKEANNKAISDYENCYDNLLPGFEPIRKAGIFSYSSFGARYDAMVGTYEDVPDLDTYILKLREEINNRKYNTSANVGIILATSGTVESSKDGVTWKPIQRGYRIRGADHLRTGADSLVRLQFSGDALGRALVKPSEVHLGPTTQVSVANLDHGSNVAESGFLTLIRGTLKAVTSGWSNGSIFSVRAGTTVCGSRGTVFGLSYDPQADQAEMTLDHGDAFFKTAGGSEVKMKPRTSVGIFRGTANAPRSISTAEWEQIEAMTNISGVQNNPVTVSAAPVSAVAPQRTSDLDQSVATTANRLTEKLLSGLREADADLVYQSTGGEYHASLESRKKQTGDLRGYLQKSKQRPVAFTIGCTVCRTGTADCWSYADVTTISKPDAKQRVIFESANEGGRSVIMTSRSWDDENEKLFHQRGRAYCD